jgi:hypothetical protein
MELFYVHFQGPGEYFDVVLSTCPLAVIQKLTRLNALCDVSAFTDVHDV